MLSLIRDAFFLFSLLMTFLLVPAPVCAQRGNPDVALDGETVDQMVATFMKEHRIPGMTLAIVQAPYVSRVVGYGTADVEKRLLASPRTLWNVGQLTRAYTAVAVVQLAEMGKLTLDDRVGTHLADLPMAWQSITLRQLLAHSSGLPDYVDQPGFRPELDSRAGEILALVRNRPVEAAPGARVKPSATDFLLLSLVVEKVSGMTFEAFVTKHQIERLGLKSTVFASTVGDVPREEVEKNDFKHREFLRDRQYIHPAEGATGYAEREGKLVAVPRNSQGAWNGFGAVFASAEDISLWDIGLAGSVLVSRPENRAFLYRGVNLNDNSSVPAHCGWRFPGHKGLMDIEGHVPGFSCYLSRFTDRSELLCVTLCANKEGVDLSVLARRIAGAFDRRLGPPVGAGVMTCRESCFSVGDTVDRLETFLKDRKVEISARINHTAAAARQNLEMPPAEVLIFGNPAVGTYLMQKHPSAALDLPLRVAVWQEADGTVWLGYHDVAGIAASHGAIEHPEIVAGMRTALTAAVRHATVPY